jgi:predicted GNAT superfamily acetyltransferase
MAHLRTATESDVASMVEINNSGYPAVPLAQAEDIAALMALSCLVLIAEDDQGVPLGFLMAMDPGQNYDSENYVFFESRFTNHLYIDRIVLTEDARGLGVGSELYERVFQRAKDDGRERVTCEVNLEPPNPGSLRFHRRWGFEDVDTQPTKGGHVVVQLLQAPVA